MKERRKLGDVRDGGRGGICKRRNCDERRPQPEKGFPLKDLQEKGRGRAFFSLYLPGREKLSIQKGNQEKAGSDGKDKYPLLYTTLRKAAESNPSLPMHGVSHTRGTLEGRK